MTGDDLTTDLRGALAARGLDGEVVGLERLTGGASKETWSLDLVTGTSTQKLILQRARAGGIRTGVGMKGEAELVRAAEDAGVPVPAMLAWSTEPDALGEAWAVTERLAGETIPRRVHRSLDAGAADALTQQLGRAAAAIHRIDRERVPHLHDADQVGQFRSLLDDVGMCSPAFEIGLQWLEANRPAATEPAVVHGDLRLGNLIVDDDGLRAVIDWELAHVGDPMEDLAWPCVRSWRFGGTEPVGGFGRRETFYEAYEAESGVAVDWKRAHWWEVLSTLKWGVMCMLQAQTHLAGLTRSVELAAIGRRICENEYDLLLLIDPDLVEGDLADAGDDSAEHAPGSDLYGRPTAAELVEAVREFLRSDVLEATDGRVQFHTRVAANALAIVERELIDGRSAEHRHAVRLEALGVTDEVALAAAIRSGESSGHDVTHAVWRSVVEKLSVANPKHLAG